MDSETQLENIITNEENNTEENDYSTHIGVATGTLLFGTAGGSAYFLLSDGDKISSDSKNVAKHGAFSSKKQQPQSSQNAKYQLNIPAKDTQNSSLATQNSREEKQSLLPMKESFEPSTPQISECHTASTYGPSSEYIKSNPKPTETKQTAAMHNNGSLLNSSRLSMSDSRYNDSSQNQSKISQYKSQKDGTSFVNHNNRKLKSSVKLSAFKTEQKEDEDNSLELSLNMETQKKNCEPLKP